MPSIPQRRRFEIFYEREILQKAADGAGWVRDDVNSTPKLSKQINDFIEKTRCLIHYVSNPTILPYSKTEAQFVREISVTVLYTAAMEYDGAAANATNARPSVGSAAEDQNVTVKRSDGVAGSFAFLNADDPRIAQAMAEAREKEKGD